MCETNINKKPIYINFCKKNTFHEMCETNIKKKPICINFRKKNTFRRIFGEKCSTSHINPFMPTVPTFAVRETDVSQHNGGTSGAPLKPPRDDSALRALSSLRGLLECWNGGQKLVNTTHLA